ncbi:MAG: hypothetical protein KIH69_005760 [Anaerolineae bacterium]|nr:hypothetical protein [Anaerolineae bacterium]
MDTALTIPTSDDSLENNLNTPPKKNNIFKRIALKAQHTVSKAIRNGADRAGKLADNTKHKASAAAQNSANKASELANKAKQQTSSSVKAVAGKASELGDKAKTQVSNTAHTAATKASDIAGKAKTQVGQVAQKTTDKAGDLANKASSTVSNAAEQVYGNVKDELHYRRNRAQYAEAIQKWAATPPQNTGDENLALAAAWVQQLPAKDLQAFTDGMASYLDSFGLNIDWVLRERFPLAPNVQHSITATAWQYGVSAWQAQQARPAINAQLAYETWAAAPEKQTAYGQQLFEKLSTRGLVTISSGIIFADDKARAKSLVEMAHNAHTAHPQDFNAVLNEM